MTATAARLRMGLALALWPIAVAAQDAPTFRTGAHLVQISVIVRDGNGPVVDLTREDFQLTDRGKTVPVAVFSLEASRGKATKEEALPVNTFSNHRLGAASLPPSVTVILLDALNTLHYPVEFWDQNGPTRFENLSLAFAKRHLLRFIEDVQPHDPIAIYSLGKDLRVISDFSDDPNRLRQALADYRESSITNAESAEPAQFHSDVPGDFNAMTDRFNSVLAAQLSGRRAERTVAALASIARRLAPIPGRKNLVWLTASLPISGKTAARVLGEKVAVYPVDARGLVTSFTPGFAPPGLGVMADLAAATGGRAFYNNNDLKGAIRRAVDDGSVSYTLGFYPEAGSLDGKFHELKLRVSRPGVQALYPTRYLASPAMPRIEAQDRMNLSSAIAAPVQFSAIPLNVSVQRLRSSKGDSVKLSGAIDVQAIQVRQRGEERDGALDIWVVQEDKTGLVLGQSRDTLTLKLTAAQYANWLQSGLHFVKTIEAQQAAASLRIVVEDDATARIGSVIIPLGEVK